MPQDIRSSPDGNVFYVADMQAGGVTSSTRRAFRRIGFIQTASGRTASIPAGTGSCCT